MTHNSTICFGPLSPPLAFALIQINPEEPALTLAQSYLMSKSLSGVLESSWFPLPNQIVQEGFYKAISYIKGLVKGKKLST